MRYRPDSYGPDARNRLAEAAEPGADGAHAALESFYYALNARDAAALAADWSTHELAQLNNPVGGILRGGEQVVELYERIFSGPVALEITFSDFVEYLGPEHAVFAGRESGTYRLGDAPPVDLEIRTSRYFRYDGGRWRQFHHHGSIDDPGALDRYQRAVRG